MSALLALCLSTAAAAGPAGPGVPDTTRPPASSLAITDVTGWTVTQYNDRLVGVELTTFRGIIASERELASGARTEENVRQYLLDTRQYLVEAEAATRHVPAWEGDASLADAVHEGFAWMLAAWDRDVGESFRILRADEVHNADLAKVEALFRDLDEGGAAIDAHVRAVLADFARRHHHTLVHVDEPPPPPPLPEFRMPGIPPANSRLGGTIHVGFAVRYLNPFVESGNRMIGVVNQYFDATRAGPDALEPARKEAVRVLREELDAARKREDWQGDASLRDALVAAGEKYLGVMEHEFADYGALATKAGGLSKDEADHANYCVDAGNAGVKDAITALTAAQQAFRERWGIAAYAEWTKAQEAMGAGAPAPQDASVPPDASAPPDAPAPPDASAPPDATAPQDASHGDASAPGPGTPSPAPDAPGDAPASQTRPAKR